MTSQIILNICVGAARCANKRMNICGVVVAAWKTCFTAEQRHLVLTAETFHPNVTHSTGSGAVVPEVEYRARSRPGFRSPCGRDAPASSIAATNQPLTQQVE